MRIFSLKNNYFQVYFKCNGRRCNGSPLSDFYDPQTGVRILEAECNVTKNQVYDFFGKDRYRCECIAWSGQGKIKSQPAYVEVVCKYTFLYIWKKKYIMCFLLKIFVEN